VLRDDGGAAGLAAAHPRAVVSPGLPAGTGLLTEAGRDGLATAELSVAGRQYVDAALRRNDELTAEIDPAANAIGELRAAPGWLSGAAGPPLRGGLVVRGDEPFRGEPL
jgi:hypothetical protein